MLSSVKSFAKQWLPDFFREKCLSGVIVLPLFIILLAIVEIQTGAALSVIAKAKSAEVDVVEQIPLVWRTVGMSPITSTPCAKA